MLFSCFTRFQAKVHVIMYTLEHQYPQRSIDFCLAPWERMVGVVVVLRNRLVPLSSSILIDEDEFAAIIDWMNTFTFLVSWLRFITIIMGVIILRGQGD